LKLKTLLVMSLFVLGCSFASAQTFGFASTGGGYYCNYEQLLNYGDGFYSGLDNESLCGANSGSLSGFASTLANDNGEVHGAGVILGDSVYAANGSSNSQWTYFTALKANAVNPKTGEFKGHYSWIGLGGESGELFFANYGFLSSSLPSKESGDAVVRGSASGKASEFKKK
jgi:hypothetical protein